MRYLLLALALLTACSSPTEPETGPTGARPADPPAVYARWYREMEQCSGLPGDFSRVEWYVVPGETWYHHGFGTEIDGLHVPPDTIYIAEASRFDRDLVTHEILHHLLYLDRGDHDHPAPPYGVCAPNPA